MNLLCINNADTIINMEKIVKVTFSKDRFSDERDYLRIILTDDEISVHGVNAEKIYAEIKRNSNVIL